MQRWNKWLLNRTRVGLGTPSFSVRWEAEGGEVIAPQDVPNWVESHPGEDLWVCATMNETSLRHKLIDNQNWLVLTMNE